MLGPAVQTWPVLFFCRCYFESEFRGNPHLSAEGSECLSNKLFVSKWSVDFSGIEKCDAAIHRRSNQCDCLVFLSGRTVTKAQSHTAESDSRHFEIAVAKFALLHFQIPLLVG